MKIAAPLNIWATLCPLIQSKFTYDITRDIKNNTPVPSTVTGLQHSLSENTKQ